MNKEMVQKIQERIEKGGYAKAFLTDLYERMFLIREFEEQVKFLFLEGKMPGTIHQCQGQEAAAVGTCSALNADDFITSTHRPHGHALAKGLTPEEMLSELYGASTGCCKGKGGSMHVGNVDKGMIPAIAIVGGNIPVATGMALAFKLKKSKQVVACFFGDGATGEGAFHEGINMAAIWDVPAIFLCENNFYGASTSIETSMRLDRVADRALGCGVPGEQIEANDVLGVYEAVSKAADTCRQGKGPVFLELMTYRITGHSRRDPCHYQPEEEKKAWLEKDPIPLLGQALINSGTCEQAEVDAIRERVEQQIEAAIAHAQQEPLPTLDDMETDVFAEPTSNVSA
jgi:pyruvate dehydrogenase E1 component alpha subunit